MRRFFLTFSCFGVLLFFVQDCTACSCFHDSLQQTIFKSDEIIFGKVSRLSKVSNLKISQRDREEKIKLSELQVLKGTIITPELEMRDFRIPDNPMCSCTFPTESDNNLDETWSVVLKGKRMETGFFNCEKPEGCSEFFQYVKEIIEIQKQPNWQGSDDEKRWLIKSMTSDAMGGLVLRELFDFDTGLGREIKFKFQKSFYS